ncbi:hypothetical protein H0H93_001126 [Arthromyces matolae]|nr:hypothetical protein H0H93_001126 [Arthromyces matolae]
MASITPTLLWLTSNIISSGVDSVFRPSSNRPPLEYQPITPKSSLIKPLEPLSLNIARPDWVCIAVDGYSSDCPWTIDNAHLLVDTTRPITVEARLTSRAPSPLYESFRKLGEAVNLIGTEVVAFKSWHQLIVALPRFDLSYGTSCVSEPLPVDALQNLRSLEWKGSSVQGLFSWFFPTFPLALQTVTIQTELSLNDCVFIIRHGKGLKTLILETVQSTSLVDSVYSPLDFRPLSRSQVFLETLDISSDIDISPLFSFFDFVSLISFTAYLYSPFQLSSLYDEKSLHWSDLQEVTLYGVIAQEDQERIHRWCGPKTDFAIIQ